MERAIVFEGPEQVSVFRAIAIKSAIKLYAKTGMKANRMYTPRNMRIAAEDITGKKFKARDYMGMVDAIQAWLDAQHKVTDFSKE